MSTDSIQDQLKCAISACVVPKNCQSEFHIPVGVEHELVKVGTNALQKNIAGLADAAAQHDPLGVGGAAQIKAMKKIAAPIRVELAQYRELAAFAQFGSELDADTKEKLAQGERIKEILKQPQYQPMPVQYQVMIIYAATNKYLLDIEVEDITRFEKEFFAFVDTKYPEIPENIAKEQVISPETEELLIKAIGDFKADFK